MSTKRFAGPLRITCAQNVVELFPRTQDTGFTQYLMVSDSGIGRSVIFE